MKTQQTYTQPKFFNKTGKDYYKENSAAIMMIQPDGKVKACIIHAMYNTTEWKQALREKYGQKRECERLIEKGGLLALPKAVDPAATTSVDSKLLRTGETTYVFDNIVQATTKLKNMNVLFTFTFNKNGFDCQSINNGTATFRIRSKKELHAYRLQQRKLEQPK